MTERVNMAWIGRKGADPNVYYAKNGKPGLLQKYPIKTFKIKRIYAKLYLQAMWNLIMNLVRAQISKIK